MSPDQSAGSPGGELRQDLGFHDIDAGVDSVREDLPPGRLLKEALDPAVVVHDDDAEFQRVGDPGQPDRDQGAVVLVEPDQLGQVDVGERVTRDHQERLIPQRVLRVFHAARGTERCLLGRVLQAHVEVLAVAEVIAHYGGEELDGDDGLAEAVPPQQPQHVLHDRFVHHRQQRLRLIGGHRPQPRALPACHHDSLHRWMPSLFPLIRLRAWVMYSSAAHQ